MRGNSEKPPRRSTRREGEEKPSTATVNSPPAAGKCDPKLNDTFQELDHVPIRNIPICEIEPSPENDKLYKPVCSTDPEIVELAQSIEKHGIIEPLVITQDYYILSGHRRFVAARLADLKTVPCRIRPFNHNDDPDQFVILLREYNRQREKSFDEKLREVVVTINPNDAYQSLIEHRAAQSAVEGDHMAIGERKHRAAISFAKRGFLNAILAVLKDNRSFWPLSDRQVHYRLLNSPPLRHSSKPDSVYCNDPASYKSLTDLLTRARLDGTVPMQAIADETRPVIMWDTWPDVRGFIQSEVNELLKGYWRNLMQSQANHIEILVEKNTVAGLVKTVAMQFCIPVTSGRGYCSLPPRYEMAQRFKRSGKEKLIILIASDFDADGEEIARSFARSMRDDFDIASIHPIKIALTSEQVHRFELKPQMLAKESSTNYARFVAENGKNVFELEALEPETLQTLVREAIDGVLDRSLFNAEIDQEKKDAAEIEALRRIVVKSIQERTAA